MPWNTRGIDRKGGETWEDIVGKGAREYAKRKGMIGLLGELSHSEEEGVKVENGEYWDSASGVPLCPLLFQQARRADMEQVWNHGVYIKASTK